jgi:DNA modification methylase|nr:MAG TPA: adenine specific DNA methyltransferase [Caudoviricetes sp.]
MEITKRRLADIVPYAANAKKHDKRQINNVAESIKQYGFVQPIVIDRDGVIVIGHCRALAAKKLGMEEVPCVCVDDLTPEQVNALRLVDNKSNESDWDFDLLADELPDLDLSAFDFDWGLPEDQQEEVIEDMAPAVDEENDPVAKPGDIWKLGEHRLMCGDSTSIDAVEALMGGQMADMVFTDPPYGYSYQSNMREKSKKFDVLENDDKILDFFPNIRLLCNGFVFICTTWKVLDKWLPLFKQYHDLTNMIIWDKGGGGIGDLKHTFSTDYEVILCSNNGREIKGKRIGSVWNIPKDSANEYAHPTQKPVKLSEFAIRNTTERGGTVLDLFGGSGSTLIACEQLDRRCCMMELDPRYCDVIIKRWEQFTGEKAVLLHD